MAAPYAALRLIAEFFNDVGEEAADEIDTGQLPSPLPLLSVTDRNAKRHTLANGATDEALTFTSAVALIIVTTDYPFTVKRASGETAWTNVRSFCVWADDTDAAVATTSVLLSGNGANDAHLLIWVIEKPS